MPDAAHVIAGRCTTVFEGTREQEQHGDMIVLIKPDNTVLVHDADGYQPVAWLTRPESVTVTTDTVIAQDGDQTLQLIINETYARSQYPTSEAGIPVGTCPDCSGSLVRANGSLSCPECSQSYPIPSNATILDDRCDECGLPQLRVKRGVSFVLCPDCDSLDERVRTAFDREWSCPDCGDDLRVLRRSRLLLGCDRYPDCETAYTFPTGLHDGDCGCGLPLFETSTGRSCLDSSCEDWDNQKAALSE